MIQPQNTIYFSVKRFSYSNPELNLIYSIVTQMCCISISEFINFTIGYIYSNKTAHTNKLNVVNKNMKFQRIPSIINTKTKISMDTMCWRRSTEELFQCGNLLC